MDTLKDLIYATRIKDETWPVLPIVAANTETGEIVYVNPFAANIFGYRVKELLHQQLEVLIPAPLRASHAEWRKDVITPRMRMMGLGRQVYGLRKSGEKFPASVTLTSVEIEGVIYGVALIVDLTGILTGIDPDMGPISPSPDDPDEQIADLLKTGTGIIDT